MIQKKLVPICMLVILFAVPTLAMGYSSSDTPTYAWGDEDTSGTGIANAAGDEVEGECRVYSDSAFWQTVAVAGLFGYSVYSGSHTWTVAIDATLQAYMTKAYGYATISIYLAILDSDKDEIEAILVWQRDLTQYNPRSFNDATIDQSDTFTATADARYFGVWIYASVAWGATICQDSGHTSSGYPAVLTVDQISWSC